MDEEAETKAIEKWLQMVDKPLETKEGDKKDAEPRDEWLQGVMGVMTDYLKSKQRKSTERCPVRPGGVSVQGGDLGGDGGVWNPTGSTIPHTSQPQF